MHICWFGGHFDAEYTPSPKFRRAAKASLSVISPVASRAEDRAGLGRVAQPEATDQDAAVLGDDGAQRVPVVGRPAGAQPGVRSAASSQHRGPSGLHVHVEQGSWG